MGIRDINIDRTAQTPRKLLVVPVVTATGLTDAVVYKFVPGIAFRLTKVRSYARTVTATITAVVKVGTRTAMAAAAPVQATDTLHTLSTTAANLRGTSTEAISIELTTNGSGAAVNLAYTIEYRPLGLAKDQGVAD